MKTLDHKGMYSKRFMRMLEKRHRESTRAIKLEKAGKVRFKPWYWKMESYWKPMDDKKGKALLVEWSRRLYSQAITESLAEALTDLVKTRTKGTIRKARKQLGRFRRVKRFENRDC
jgi:hypothetical protein